MSRHVLPDGLRAYTGRALPRIMNSAVITAFKKNLIASIMFDKLLVAMLVVYMTAHSVTRRMNGQNTYYPTLLRISCQQALCMNKSHTKQPIIISIILFILFAEACTPKNSNHDNETDSAPTQLNAPEAAITDTSAKDEIAVDPLAVKPDVVHHQDDKVRPANSDIPIISDNIEQPVTDASEQPVASNRLSPKIYKSPIASDDFGGLKCETTLKYHDQSVYVSKEFKRNTHYTNDEAIDLLLQKGCKRVCDEILKDDSADCIKDCSENGSFDSPIRCYIMKLDPKNIRVTML